MSESYRTVRFEGDFAINRYPEIHAELVGYPGTDVSPILVDLSNVEFADSTCLAELLFLARRCSAANVPFVVLARTSQVLNIIAQANLTQQLRIVRDMESARAALSSSEVA